MKHYTISTLASTYGSCNYGGDQYDQNGACTSGTGTTTGGSSNSGGSSAGGLANTGFDIALAASLACVIIFCALMVRFFRRPAQTKK